MRLPRILVLIICYLPDDPARGVRREREGAVLGSWVKPRGTRLGIRKVVKDAVRLPKILVLN